MATPDCRRFRQQQQYRYARQYRPGLQTARCIDPPGAIVTTTRVPRVPRLFLTPSVVPRVCLKMRRITILKYKTQVQKNKLEYYYCMLYAKIVGFYFTHIGAVDDFISALDIAIKMAPNPLLNVRTARPFNPPKPLSVGSD